MDRIQLETKSLSIGIEISGTKTRVGIGSAADGLLPGGIVRRTIKRELGAQGILRDIQSMVDEVLSSQNSPLADVDRIDAKIVYTAAEKGDASVTGRRGCWVFNKNATEMGMSVAIQKSNQKK